MKSWSLRVGTFYGIEVFIHWTFWILLGWIFLAHLQMGRSFTKALEGALFILAIFLCVVLSITSGSSLSGCSFFSVREPKRLSSK